jgi:predicted  nucleic acid-binding Zn-ribbon protein
MKQLQSDLDAKGEKIWYHEETISSLQKTKERIEADLSEASDAIALLEDELDQKESAANSANVQVTVLRQKVSQLEKDKASISKSKEDLEEQIQDLNTQIKVIQMEKHVSNEEMESLREAKEKAEDELHEVVQSSGAQIAKLQEELDESSDAIALLKEELGIVEHREAENEDAIHALETELAEKNAHLERAEKEMNRLKTEHQVGVETISTLQKLIQTNDQKKTDIELELKAMSQNATELGQELKKSASRVRELEEKLSEYEDRNEELMERVSDLQKANDGIKKQMHEIILETTSTALVTRSASVGTSLKSISSERAKTVDALISDLRQQILDLLSERDAALEEVEVLKQGSNAICPRPDNHDDVSDVLTEAPDDDHDDDMTYHTSALETKPCEEGASIPLTIEPAKKKKSANVSHTSSQPSKDGNTLLEQAKSIVQEFEVKRSTTPDVKRGTNDDQKLSSRISQDGSTKTVQNNIKGKELGGILDNVPDTNPASRTNSAASVKKFDIDQLTAIYFEKCGMSASKLSDMSSDASSSVYRRAKQQRDKDNSKAKKVKICRNGVFMGTYEGDLNAKGQRHGFGVLICDNGNSYEGDWKNDKRDGLGIGEFLLILLLLPLFTFLLHYCNA